MKLPVKTMTKTVLIASLYIVITLLCYPFAYGAIQFRLSEVMALLALVDPLYIPGLLLGCFVSNLLGIGGLVDAVFGTFASAVSLAGIYYSGKWIQNRSLGLIVASLWPSISSFIIAFEMTFILQDSQSFLFWTVMVAIGEFCVVTVLGVPLMHFVLSKPHLVAILKKIRET